MAEKHESKTRAAASKAETDAAKETAAPRFQSRQYLDHPETAAEQEDGSIGLYVGAIVHYVMPDAQENGADEQTHRAAIVVRRFSSLAVNLHVFFDSPNDASIETPVPHPWHGSVSYSRTCEPNTWHWPELPQ